MGDDDVIQVTMLDVLREPFTEWLRSHGMDLALMPPPESIPVPKPDYLPQYIVIPSEDNPIMQAIKILKGL